MFIKGTFKDILTNILSILTVIGTIIKVILDYSVTANLENPFLYFVGLIVALGLWFIGKGGDGKAKKLPIIFLAMLLASSMSYAQTSGAQTTAITNYKVGMIGAAYVVSFDFTQDSTGSQVSPEIIIPQGIDPTKFTFRVKAGRTAVSGVPNKEIFLQAVMYDGDTVSVDTLVRTAVNQRETDSIGYRDPALYGGNHIPLTFSTVKIFIRVITADVDLGEFDIWWAADPKTVFLNRKELAPKLK